MPIDNTRHTLLILASSFEQPEKTATLLRKASFNVAQAEDTEDVIRQCGSTQPPSLIIINIEEATEEVFANIQRLRRNRHTRPIALLLLIPLAAHSRFPDNLFSGMTDFIIKPYPGKELAIRIQQQLLSQEVHRTLLQQNQKLQKSVEYRDKLYSVIAHDLRAPISTIKMINSSLENDRDKIADPQIRKKFDMINETTEEAFNLLENLLRWSRNQKGKTRLYPAIFNITTAARQVMSLFANIASAKKINLTNLAQQDVFVYADEDMAKAILRNLISNAVKFTFSGGHITLRIHETEESVMVSVEDDGQGIKQEIQPLLLKVNEHVTTYGTQNEKGSGLGLTLCRDFIKMNKGKLWFTSQENQGTTFFFTLPKHPPVPSVSPASRR